MQPGKPVVGSTSGFKAHSALTAVVKLSLSVLHFNQSEIGVFI